MKQFIKPAGTIFGLLVLILITVFAGRLSHPASVAPAAETTSTNGNLILNPSVEQGTANWKKNNWGGNTTNFSYDTPGHNSAHSVTTKVSRYKSGDAKWFPNPVSVKPSTSYTFSDWYQSSVAGEIDAVITTKNGATNYMWLASTPASSSWKQAKITFTTPANASKITFYHVINKNGQLTVDDYDFRLATPGSPTTPTIPTPSSAPTPTPVTPQAPQPTAPTVSITNPTANDVVKGAQTITVDANDAQAITKVQYRLDGKDLGTVTTAPYSSNWDTTRVGNGTHTLTAVVTNVAGLSASSKPVTVYVQNPTPPTIQITSPAAGATVSGNQSINASVADKQGISKVQYLLDGQPLGSPVTTVPYSFSWDTTKASNGTHTLTAVVTNTANLSSTAASVTVKVANQVTTPTSPVVGPNTIPNPSVETPDPASSNEPQHWNADSWGNNTAVFNYLNTGHSGNRSTKVTVSNYVEGAANWSYVAQNVEPGHYRYTNWYKSDVATEIDAAVTVNGVVQYYYLGSVPASADWSQAVAEFDIPAGATSVTIFHLIAANGSLTTDDFSFAKFTPTPFNRGLVSITFDDGWMNQHTNALPLLNKYGQKATFYIMSGELNNQPYYMSSGHVNDLISGGHEIGSHTITHADLTTLSADQIRHEMQQNQTVLQTLFGVPVTNFAYPFGAHNANTVAIGRELYASQRTVVSGFNNKNNFDVTKLVVQNVYNTTTPAQIKAWIDQANHDNTWLILVYHEVADVPLDPSDADYTTRPADLDAALKHLYDSGITVKTVREALDELLPQL